MYEFFVDFGLYFSYFEIFSNLVVGHLITASGARVGPHCHCATIIDVIFPIFLGKRYWWGKHEGGDEFQYDTGYVLI